MFQHCKNKIYDGIMLIACAIISLLLIISAFLIFYSIYECCTCIIDKWNIDNYKTQMKEIAKCRNFDQFYNHERINVIKVQGKPRMAMILSEGICFSRCYQDIIIVVDNGQYGHFYKEESYCWLNDSDVSNVKLVKFILLHLADPGQILKSRSGVGKSISDKSTQYCMEQQEEIYKEMLNIKEFMEKRGYTKINE